MSEVLSQQVYITVIMVMATGFCTNLHYSVLYSILKLPSYYQRFNKILYRKSFLTAVQLCIHTQLHAKEHKINTGTV